MRSKLGDADADVDARRRGVSEQVGMRRSSSPRRSGGVCFRLWGRWGDGDVARVDGEKALRGLVLLLVLFSGYVDRVGVSVR